MCGATKNLNVTPQMHYIYILWANKDRAMSTVFHIMKDEFNRLKSAEEAYCKAMEGLPVGSARIKHLRNRDYLYLKRREGEKIITDYIGPVESEKAQKVLDLVRKRLKYTLLLKQIHRDLKEVQKVLRGKI